MPEQNGNSEYHIPKLPESANTESIPSYPDEAKAFVDDVTRYVAEQYVSIDRQSEFYGNRQAILAEEAERRREREGVIALGNDILALRRAEIENRLHTSNSNVLRQVLNMIMTGQVGLTVDKNWLADETFRVMMNEESAIGASIVPMPSTVARHEFFLSDDPLRPYEWFLHAQSRIDPNKSTTIRYVVSEQDGVFKSTDGGPYSLLNSDELLNFMQTTQVYADQLKNVTYKNVSRSDFSLAA